MLCCQALGRGCIVRFCPGFDPGETAPPPERVEGPPAYRFARNGHGRWTRLCGRSGRDGAQIVIDLVLHVDLDVGLGAGLDVAIVFGEIHPAEIERLELFC